MQNFNYTQSEADALVGSRFQTQVEWDHIAKGRRGHVIASSGRNVWASQGSYESYEVIIEWDRLPGDAHSHDLPLQGWFSKFQMEKYMRSVKS